MVGDGGIIASPDEELCVGSVICSASSSLSSPVSSWASVISGIGDVVVILFCFYVEVDNIMLCMLPMGPRVATVWERTWVGIARADHTVVAPLAHIGPLLSWVPMVGCV